MPDALAHRPLHTGPVRSGAHAIRLMVVDDSITARTVYSRVVENEHDLELAAVAGTAEDALAALATVRVDVILLDLEMPGMGGLEALPRMLEAAPGAQVLVVSSLTHEGAEHTMRALALGAADTLSKPEPGKFDREYRSHLVDRIREIGGTVRRGQRPPLLVNRPPVVIRKDMPRHARVLAIGASTGGIHALSRLFAGLPPRISVPILVTQHLPVSFMDVFARQLEAASGRETVLARDRIALVPDRIVIAPGDAHMTVVERSGQYEVKLDRKPAPSGCRPSVDPMFASLAQAYGPHALGVVLSGMGRDGTAGAKEIVAAGGTVLAQDEASCAVWGMPGAIATAGLASSVLPPEQLAGRIVAGTGGARWS
ncbi:MAG: chemotaxis-specific protein-glutamate methyltransferase CheB [Novosphingobium sp.]|nr:chemotaxis-specific protein-glutamate methyltransferase CheB [Novosphingobium sp.]